MTTFIEFEDLKGNNIVMNTSDIVFIQSGGKDAKVYVRNYNIFHHPITISLGEYLKIKTTLIELKCHHEAKKDF